MPGDPLRAKLIAEEYLENCILFNQGEEICSVIQGLVHKGL